MTEHYPRQERTCFDCAMSSGIEIQMNDDGSVEGRFSLGCTHMLPLVMETIRVAKAQAEATKKR